MIETNDYTLRDRVRAEKVGKNEEKTIMVRINNWLVCFAPGSKGFMKFKYVSYEMNKRNQMNEDYDKNEHGYDNFSYDIKALGEKESLVKIIQ